MAAAQSKSGRVWPHCGICKGKSTDTDTAQNVQEGFVIRFANSSLRPKRVRHAYLRLQPSLHDWGCPVRNIVS